MNYDFQTHLYEMPEPVDFDEALDQCTLLKDALREVLMVDEVGVAFSHLTKTQRLFVSALYKARSPVPIARLADIRKAWDAHLSSNIENVVRVQISRIRELLPPRSIDTIYGSGYVMTKTGREFVSAKIAEAVQ